MLFERSDLLTRTIRTPATRRVWGGLVHGFPDCWVVVARDEQELVDWSDAEEQAIEEVPLRIRRAILDDDCIVLSGRIDDVVPTAPYPDLPCL